MSRNASPSEFIQYLLASDTAERVPPLNILSQILSVSISRLREQLEAAKTLGLVEVRPRTGIRRLPYSFTPAVRQSLAYAIELDRSYFDAFSDVRNHLESAFWHEAVSLLEPQDHRELQRLMRCAWDKLHSPQVKIPHEEHRQLHMVIYQHLDNPFVLGMLEAYWEAYEAVGLNMYADYDYLQQVWNYHQRMVDAICIGDHQAGFEALSEHRDLLYHRPVASLMGHAVGLTNSRTAPLPEGKEYLVPE